MLGRQSLCRCSALPWIVENAVRAPAGGPANDLFRIDVDAQLEVAAKSSRKRPVQRSRVEPEDCIRNVLRLKEVPNLVDRVVFASCFECRVSAACGAVCIASRVAVAPLARVRQLGINVPVGGPCHEDIINLELAVATSQRICGCHLL